MQQGNAAPQAPLLSKDTGSPRASRVEWCLQTVSSCWLRSDPSQALTADFALQYMAPEVLARQHYSEKADVYSFGIVLFECCSRQVLSAFLWAHETTYIGCFEAPAGQMPLWRLPDTLRDASVRAASKIKQCIGGVPLRHA